MKKFLSTFLFLILIGLSTSNTFASTVDQNLVIPAEVNAADDIQQEEIDRRMNVIFGYLNEYANNPAYIDQKSFDIQVEKDVIVNAEISNQEVTKSRALGSTNFKVKANTSYVYTLTVSNVVGSGDITRYTVNYRTGSASSNGAHSITVNSVSISGSAPSGYSLGTKFTWIGNSNGNIIVSTGGYITYTRKLLANKTLNFNSVSLGSTPNNNLTVDYSYGVY